MFVIVTRERKAVKCENEFSKANKRCGARLFVSALVHKLYLSARRLSWLGITLYNEVISIAKITLFWPGKLKSRKDFERMISVFDI